MSTSWHTMAAANQTQNLGDGYEVKGKFTSKTGGSTAKAKAQPKGYKGTTVTGDPSKDKSESTVPKMSTFGHSSEDKAASTADLTQYVEDEQKYETETAKPDGYDDATGQFFLQGKPVGTTAYDYSIAQGAAGIETEAQKNARLAQEKAESVADLEAEVTANTQYETVQEKEASVADIQLAADINTGWEKAVAEQSLQQEVIDNQIYEQYQQTLINTPVTATSDSGTSGTTYTSDTSISNDWWDESSNDTAPIVIEDLDIGTEGLSAHLIDTPVVSDNINPERLLIGDASLIDEGFMFQEKNSAPKVDKIGWRFSAEPKINIAKLLRTGKSSFGLNISATKTY